MRASPMDPSFGYLLEKKKEGEEDSIPEKKPGLRRPPHRGMEREKRASPLLAVQCSRGEGTGNVRVSVG